MAEKIVAVLGGGNGAHMMAADMKFKGYEVRMFEVPAFKPRLAKLFETKTIEVRGLVNRTATLDLVTDDIGEAVEGAQYVLLATPAFAHADYAQLLKGRLNASQTVVVFPGAFATLVLRQAFSDSDCPLLAEANNLPYDVRLIEPCVAKITGFNKINVAFLPAERAESAIGALRADLFPFDKIYSDVIECGLAIVNPALHTGPCLFNISSIERPDTVFYLYEHGFTPSAAKLDIALDNERKAVARELGYDVTPIEDFSGLPQGYTWRDLYRGGHGDIALTPIAGPNDIENRYLTEDCPFGLVPWSSIGALLGVPMPITNAVIDIYNVIHERDWRAIGNNAAKLGLAGLSRDQILQFAATGRK